MRVRLFVENTELDVAEEFSNQLTFAIDDIRNLDSKTTPYSKTIILPGSTRNNAALGNIFEFTSANFTIDGDPNIGYNFNAAKAADCVLYVDGFQVIKGVFRLLEIIMDNGVEYEVQIVGELGGLVAKLGNKRLENLDFSRYDHNYTTDEIVNSWSEDFTYVINTSTTFTASTKKIKVSLRILDNLDVGDTITIAGTASNNGTFTITAIEFSRIVFNRYTEITVAQTVVNETDNTGLTISYTKPFGTGYFYATIDYGNVSTNKVDFQYTAFRPALFLKEYIDKIITGAGYTWESAFFNTNFFRRIIVPNNDKGLYKRGVTEYIDANNTATQEIATGPGVNFENIIFQNSSLTNFTVNGSNTIFTYTNPAPINIRAKLIVSGTYQKSNATGLLFIRLKTNDTEVDYNFPVGSGFFSQTIELTDDMVNGDTIEVMAYSLQVTAVVDLSIFSAELIVEKDPPGKVELPIGETVFVNDTIPKGVFQKDFLASIIKMFNLMITEDKLKDRHLVIEPNPDFFNTTYEDWSDKMDRSQPIRLKPMSELNARFYEFKFKQDSDFYNEAYRKKYNEGYGDRIYDTAYDFAKETDKTEVIFSATPLFGAVGTDKVYPAIYKKSGNEGFEDTIEHNIRIMQVKRITGVNSWKILDGGTTLATLTEYGYAGHLDDPDAPASDLHFGSPKELYFSLVSGDLSANLFNAYYSGYMAEITDKDSRLLTASFRLSPADIYNLDFKTYKWIDGALFKLTKVIDWNTDGTDLVKCELLRVLNTVY